MRLKSGARYMVVGLILALAPAAGLAAEGRKPADSWAGLVNSKGINGLAGLTDKKASGSTFAVAVYTDAKAYQAFADAAALKDRGRRLAFPAAADIDWTTHGVVAVVLKAHTNWLSFKGWSVKDGAGELVFVWRGVEPLWRDAYPALIHKVARKDLKKVTVKYVGWFGDETGTVGQVEVPGAKPDAEEPVARRIDLRGLVGLDVGEAEARVRAKGLRFRVVEKDGEPLPVTCDYRTDRVNVSVANGKVVRAAGD